MLPRPVMLCGLLLLGAAAGTTPCAGQSGRPIQYSEPRGENNTPDTLLPGRTRLDQLEADLNRPFKSLFQGKSLDGMIMPTPQPLPPAAVPQPRFKEKDDKQREWMFLKPEELYPVKSAQEDRYKTPELTPDGRKVSDLRPMERRYLEMQNERQAAATNNASTGNPPAWTLEGNPYQNPPGELTPGYGLPTGVTVGSDLERSLRQAFSGKEILPPKAGDDLFGLNNGYRPTGKLTDAEVQKRDAYMQILDYNNTRGAENSAAGNFSTRWVDSSFYDPPKLPTPAPATTPALGGSLSGAVIPNVVSTWLPSVSPPPPVRPLPAPAPPSPFINAPPRSRF